MVDIAQFNELTITRFDTYGAELDAGELGELILLNRNMPDGAKVGDKVNVFVYHDSKNRLSATRVKPLAQASEAAFLKVVQVNNIGAFLDWGLPKDLLVPFNQQQLTMEVNKSYVVYVYLDEDTGRVLASSKLNRHIQHIHHAATVYKKGQAVDFLISDKTDLGFSAIINHQHWGLLFYNDIPGKQMGAQLTVGQQIKGYIKSIRDDGKINLSLEPLGFEKVDSMSTKILDELKKCDGFIPLSDKSAPELIYDRFAMSKKSFKMTIGSLYKKRMISIAKEGITLTANNSHD